jgi:hypothetical protein
VSVLVFDDTASGQNFSEVTSTDILLFDPPELRSVTEDAGTEFLLFDAPPPELQVQSASADVVVLDAPGETVVQLDTGETDFVIITAGGPAGPRGEKGDQGDQGEVGPQGATGPEGPTGPQGPTGPTGPAGADGSTTFINAFRGEHDPDTAYLRGDMVTYQGSTFIALEGSTGVTPVEGITWSTVASVGAQGPTGAQGPQGIQGQTGPQGDQGPVGPEGPQGATGAQGPQGEVGATGATGPQGPQGVKGDTGERGFGVPLGGTVGQVLTKNGDLDNDTIWADPTGGSGAGQPIITLTAGQDINLAEVVYVDDNGKAWKSSSNDANKIWRTIGIASSNALANEEVEVVQDGLLTVGTPFPIGPLFLDVDGSLTASPSTGIAQVHVADALRTTTLAVRVDPAIYY